MTLPRSMYRYRPQSVVSVNGAFRLEQTGSEKPTLTLFYEGRPSWSISLGRSLKQIFISDDGRSTALDAADMLAFRAPDGRLVGEVSLLDIACGGNHCRVGTEGSPVMPSSAGPIWDDYIAACFVAFEGSTLFVVSGRGMPPFVFDPSTTSRVPLNPETAQDALRNRASQVLRQAANVLQNRMTAEWWSHGDPWRLAAVGWARVAGETEAQDSLPPLQALANLDMAIDGMTWLGWYSQPRDPIRVNRYALDPLRQATHIALLRMGYAPPTGAVMQLARREGWFRTSWIEFPVPEGHIEALAQLSLGATPTALVDLAGPPTHVAQCGSRVVWSYDHLSPEGPRCVDVRWGKKGVEHVSNAVPIPNASPNGRLA